MCRCAPALGITKRYRGGRENRNPVLLHGGAIQAVPVAERVVIKSVVITNYRAPPPPGLVGECQERERRRTIARKLILPTRAGRDSAPAFP